MRDEELDNAAGRVYEAAAKVLYELCRPFRKALWKMGTGETFKKNLMELVERLMFLPLDKPPLSSLRMQGVTEPRRTLLAETFLGLGMHPIDARDLAFHLSLARGLYNDDGTPNPPKEKPRIGHGYIAWQAYVQIKQDAIERTARETLERLDEIVAEISKPYAGGVKQVAKLLGKFPDLADRIYAVAGFHNLAGFPATWKGAARTREGGEYRFHIALKKHVKLQRGKRWLAVAGLLILSVGLTVLTAGTLGPVAATVVGMGIGLAQSGTVVYTESQNVARGEVAVRIGAMDPSTLQRLKNNLQGAWAGLAVDVASFGLARKVGGATVLSATLRGAALDAGAGALATALDPNVWNEPGRVGLILQGAVVGGTLGVASGSVTNIATARMQKAQIGLPRDGGALTPGKEVRVGSSEDRPAMTGTVVRVDRASRTVTVRVDGSEFTLRVDRAVALHTEAARSGAQRTAKLLDRPSLQDTAPKARPRMHGKETPFSRVRDLEGAALRSPAHLQRLDGPSLMRTSSDLMPPLQRRLGELGYRTTPVRVTGDDGVPYMALQIDRAPGRFGTLLRRTGRWVDPDVKTIYDPVGMTREGGSALYDASINAVRLGPEALTAAHEGIRMPMLHELRHRKTAAAVDAGDTSYPYQGKFYFGENAAHGSVSRDYRSQFDVDEMIAYQKQSAGSLRESKRAIGIVQRDGPAALRDPKTRLFYEQGPRIGATESIKARGFAKAVRERATQMLQRLHANKGRVDVEDLDSGTFPSKAYTFKDEAGREALMIEYFVDDMGQRNAIVQMDRFDGSGRAVEGGETVLHFVLGEAPRGYHGDPTHGLVLRRLQQLLAASETTLDRSLTTEAQLRDVR